MVVCDSCGSQGVHASYGKVGGTHWICTECRQIINQIPSSAEQSSSGRVEKHPSQQPEVIEMDSVDERSLFHTKIGDICCIVPVLCQHFGLVTILESKLFVLLFYLGLPYYIILACF
ncbi:hypothetical protein MTO96_036275 [Rhipicephalus appendiculatus]